MSDDSEVYDTAKEDPIACVILDALHKQDARTYNGNGVNIGQLALDTAVAVITVLRDMGELK